MLIRILIPNPANPNGSLPTFIVNLVISEIPLCVVNVAKFIQSNGLICYIPQNPISSLVLLETYDHEPKAYTLSLTGAAGDAFDIAVDTKKMYKGGYTAIVSGALGGVSLSGQGSARLHVEVGKAADGVKFSITVKKV